MVPGLRDARRVAVDTETTGLRPYGGDQLRGVSLAWEYGGEIRSIYLPVSHPGSTNLNVHDVVTELNILQAQGARLEFHNGPFDWHFLTQHGMRVPRNYRDSQVLSWLWNENGAHGLKPLSSDAFGFDAAEEQRALKRLFRGRPQLDIYKELRADPEWQMRPAAEAKAMASELSLASRRTWATLTADEIADYAAKDAHLTYQLVDLYESMIEANQDRGDVRPAVQREHDVQHVVFDMVALGVRVDPDKAREAHAEAEARHSYIRDHFDTVYGVDLNKNVQVARLVYQEWGLPILHWTDGGAPSVNRAALEEMASTHEGVGAILEYRGLGKAMSTYFLPLIDAVGDDGRVHSSFSTARTVTGRLSSSDPNLMNIPRRDTLAGVRDVFVAEPGWELWEYDLNQAELRVSASFSKDPVLTDVLLSGRDLHNETATLVFGPGFSDLQRRVAKNINYGFPYGIGPRKLAGYMIEKGGTVIECQPWRDKYAGPKCGICTVCQAAVILNDFRAAYPALTDTMRTAEHWAEKAEYIPLHVPGRYRRFNWPGAGRRRVPSYTAYNAIVQGGVAEYMKDVMLGLDSAVGHVARLVLQVHDSLVLEVQPGCGPAVGGLLQTLADDLNPFTLPMPFTGEPWSAHA